MNQRIGAVPKVGGMSGEQREPAYGPQKIWVLGGGHFGRRAVNRLMQLFPKAAITVIDVRSLSEIPAGVEFVRGDGVTWLAEKIPLTVEPTLIIPAVPLHLAAEWLKCVIEKEGGVIEKVPMSDHFLSHLPNAIRINDWQAAVSHADFICPPDCCEPEEICSFTGKARPLPMYMILRSLVVGGFSPIILRSQQLAPGVGGFLADELVAFKEKIRTRRDVPLLVSTCCKCHGIIDGLRVLKQERP